MAKYASWIPGNSVLIEKRNAYQAIDRLSTYKITGPTFPDNEVGPIGDWAAFACLRLGWAARFVVFDTHPESDDPRSGKFWCHFAIPTPVIVEGKRAKAEKFFINFESTNAICLLGRRDGNLYDLRKTGLG